MWPNTLIIRKHPVLRFMERLLEFSFFFEFFSNPLIFLVLSFLFSTCKSMKLFLFVVMPQVDTTRYIYDSVSFPPVRKKKAGRWEKKRS